MQKLNVETGQNVVIRKDLANVGERIAAQLIDYVIMVTYYLILLLISNLFSNYSNQNVFVIIFLIPVFFYALLSEIFMQGQSLGKKALKIKVVKVSGAQPTIGNYIIRWLFKVIEGNFAILFGSPAIITIAANGKGQRLGDLVAKTSVVSLKRKDSLEDTVFVELPEKYKLIYPEVEKLELSDIKTIKDVTKHYKKNITNAAAVSMLKDTVFAVKRKTGIVSAEVPLIFLQNILSDYNYLHKPGK
ncbi:MAG: RDD family protein [Bacteroidales bacterium]|nr:RDD family protein [Bacteroidales bacterium]